MQRPVLSAFRWVFPWVTSRKPMRDVDIGVICRGDESLDGLIEESRVLIQLDAGRSGDHAPRRGVPRWKLPAADPPGLNGAVRSATVRRVSSISSRRSGHPWLLRPFIEF